MIRHKINLGCGGDYRVSTKDERWTNIEKNQKLKADLYLDLEDGYLPLKNDTQDYVLMKHVLEHIDNMMPLMDEIWRVLKPDGILEVHVPYWTYKWAAGDPTHVRMFMEDSFVFWDKASIAEQVKAGRPTTQLDCKANFKTIDVKPLLDVGVKEMYQDKPDDLKFAIEHLNNIVAELQVTLKAIK